VRRLAGRTLFEVGGREYLWDDLVVAARLWGDLREVERAAADGLACQKRLERLGEWAREPDAEDEYAQTWRYDRNLLAADDLTDWLARRSLDEDDWLDFVERRVLVSMWEADLAAIRREHPAAAAEAGAILYPEIVCSGVAVDLAERLAGRAAVYDRVGGTAGGRCPKTEVRAILKPLSSARGDIAGLRVDQARAEHLACLEIVFGRFVDGLVSPAALRREIEAHVLEWTRFRCDVVAFASDEAAREAALLVREDGMPLAEAAAAARAAVQRAQFVLEDAEPEVRDRLTAARPGDILGPLAVGDGFVLLSVAARSEPAAKQAPIRDRARERIIRRTIQREVTGRVAWIERF
jgi:hypothetical protein